MLLYNHMDNSEYLATVFNFFTDFDIFYYGNRYYKINKVL